MNLSTATRGQGAAKVFFTACCTGGGCDPTEPFSFCSVLAMSTLYLLSIHYGRFGNSSVYRQVATSVPVKETSVAQSLLATTSHLQFLMNCFFLHQHYPRVCSTLPPYHCSRYCVSTANRLSVSLLLLSANRHLISNAYRQSTDGDCLFSSLPFPLALQEGSTVSQSTQPPSRIPEVDFCDILPCDKVYCCPIHQPKPQYLPYGKANTRQKRKLHLFVLFTP